MSSFPMLVTKDNKQPQKLNIYAVRKNDLTEQSQVSNTSKTSQTSLADAVVVVESGGQTTDVSAPTAKDIKTAIRNGRSQCLSILAPQGQDAQWFIISFLTVPQSQHKELVPKWEIYTKSIFSNSKFNPVFSYFAPLEPSSDVLLSVWGFPSPRDADVYMPSSEHMEFGGSVQSYFKHVDFFQAARVDFKEAKL